MAQKYKILKGTIPEIESAVALLAAENANWILIGGAVPDKNNYIQTVARIDHSKMRYLRRLASLRGSTID